MEPRKEREEQRRSREGAEAISRNWQRKEWVSRQRIKKPTGANSGDRNEQEGEQVDQQRNKIEGIRDWVGDRGDGYWESSVDYWLLILVLA